ncbi:MAG: hypothetical protein U0325_35230 [Polyangiales bacterium]
MRALPLIAALCVGRVAFGQAPPSPTPPSAPRAASPRDAALAQGIAAYRQQRWDAAVASFREAARLDGASAVPQLYLGYASAARGDAASARGFLREALRLATVAADEPAQARARIALAMLLEGSNDWDAARDEWEQYVRFADGHTAHAPAAPGRARLEVFTRRTTVAQDAEGVRRRIEERLRVNASGANQAAPPGMVPVPAAPR